MRVGREGADRLRAHLILFQHLPQSQKHGALSLQESHRRAGPRGGGKACEGLCGAYGPNLGLLVLLSVIES